MCWVCDQDKSIVRDNWMSNLGYEPRLFQVAPHFGRSFDGRYLAEAFPFDGVGDYHADVLLPTLADLTAAALVVDTVPGDTSSLVTLTVGGPRIVSTINTPGDQDFFRVELEAGVTYEFGQYMTTSGPSGVPLADAYLEIYDSAGNLITSADGGGPFTPSGLDALLTFTPTTSGTYFLNARAYDEVPAPDDKGDFVGDYEIFARVSTYRPYYDLDSPLHSLDWGTQFDGTSRNPDNAEGPRPTGNEVENKIGGKNVIYVYFARQGDVFVDNAADPLNLTTTMVAKGLQPWEKAAFNAVFDEYEKVADIDYVETEDRWAADITVITYDGTPGPGVSLLGRMSPPDTPSEGQTEYNSGDYRWTQEGLAPGGFYFGTLIHEFGHGHGMAHPHDNGGRSSVMRGVEETGVASYTLGDFNLNQGIYTMMSYMDGWQLSPYGQAASDDGYGYLGSLMAFDIAVMQDKYGVNEEWATGNDSYVLRDENVTAQFDSNGNIIREATSYKSIWDAGGIDEIVYQGARDAHIDLRAATLKYEEGGGGWVSYAWGIYGGFTIANGVTIENIRSGSGNDTLIGNAAANVIIGGAGADSMYGGGGNDHYLVEDAGDRVFEYAGEGWDAVHLRTSYTLAAGSHVEQMLVEIRATTNVINLTGNELDNVLQGNDGTNVIVGGGGRDVMMGYGGHDHYLVDSADDIIYEFAGEGWDTVHLRSSYTLAGGAEIEHMLVEIAATTNAINLTGNEFNNVIAGNNGANVIDGKGGNDVLQGYGGADQFAFTTALDAVGNVDRIYGFDVAEDRILLDDAIFTGLGLGALSASAFVVGSAAADADDRIIYDSSTGALYFDADGNGAGEAILFARLDPGLSLSASDFAVI